MCQKLVSGHRRQHFDLNSRVQSILNTCTLISADATNISRAHKDSLGRQISRFCDAASRVRSNTRSERRLRPPWKLRCICRHNESLWRRPPPKEHKSHAKITILHFKMFRHFKFQFSFSKFQLIFQHTHTYIYMCVCIYIYIYIYIYNLF